MRADDEGHVASVGVFNAVLGEFMGGSEVSLRVILWFVLDKLERGGLLSWL